MASTYSVISDLLIGDMPVAVGFSKQKFVDDAADEVDSIIGRRYVTPLDVSVTSAIPRHGRLFIKRAANHLASGRLILALASGGEDQQVHAYGWSLVKGALDALEQVANGTYELKGAVPTGEAGDQTVGPSIKNVDATSGVEAYYQGHDILQPALSISGYPNLDVPIWAPGGGDD